VLEGGGEVVVTKLSKLGKTLMFGSLPTGGFLETLAELAL